MFPETPRAFRSMGVDVLVSGATPDELALVQSLFAEWDRVFSRFRPDSELTRVNRTEAEVLVVSPLFARAVGSALRAAELTDGLLDPTLGAAIEAAGYDRDFSLLGPDSRPPAPGVPGRRGEVRLTGRLLTRPPEVQLDLNGVVKALAVDEALRLLAGDGFVAAGGDVAARRPVVVGLPGDESVRLLAGGVATSGSTRRRWTRGGEAQHHLLDARTGRPAVSRWTEVTVAGPSCLTADVAAKAAFLLSVDGPAWLDSLGLPGRFREPSGVVANETWRSALAAGADRIEAAA